MCVLASRDTPYLLNWIEVWRIWRQFYEDGLFSNVRIFGVLFVFYQPDSLLVPWGIVHDEGILLISGNWISADVLSETRDCCLIVEP